MLTVTNSHDLARYNTAAIIDAYQRTFSSHDDVVLVIKDYGASSGDTSIRRRLKEASQGAAVEYVSAFSDKRALIQLYKSCDAFVSAHRGEGFGMKILDAMACGLPVITPLFGGPTAYCHADNCYPVAFSLAPMVDCLDTRSLHITNQPMWAEVDGASLAERMREAYTDRTRRRRSASVAARPWSIDSPGAAPPIASSRSRWRDTSSGRCRNSRPSARWSRRSGRPTGWACA